MKEIKLMIDGKEVALTKKQIKALGIDVDDGCVCDRVKKGEKFWLVDEFCVARKGPELDAVWNMDMYKSGNYYRSESYAKQVALHQKLNNLLRRFSEQHGGDVEWDGTKEHWSIYFDCYGKSCHALLSFQEKSIFDVFFSENEVAKKAIEEVVKPFMAEHPEFVW